MTEDESLTTDRLGKLSALAGEYQDLELEIFKAENHLTDLKKRLERISRVEIPAILNEAELSDIRLKDGKKLEVRDKIKPSLAKGKVEEALTAMQELEETEEAKQAVAAMFKSSLVVGEVSDEVQQLLIDEGISFDFNRSIHHQTLSKYCRNRIESGQPVPEVIGVFQYQETTIK